jgi:hypothetical protein
VAASTTSSEPWHAAAAVYVNRKCECEAESVTAIGQTIGYNYFLVNHGMSPFGVLLLRLCFLQCLQLPFGWYIQEGGNGLYRVPNICNTVIISQKEHNLFL